MVTRFLSWKLPKDFAPDCGISFDGRKDDEWNKNKTWPVGTNLLSADQARAMIMHLLGDSSPIPDHEQKQQQQPVVNRYCRAGMCVKTDDKHEPNCTAHSQLKQ